VLSKNTLDKLKIQNTFYLLPNVNVSNSQIFLQPKYVEQLPLGHILATLWYFTPRCISSKC